MEVSLKTESLDLVKHPTELPPSGEPNVYGVLAGQALKQSEEKLIGDGLRAVEIADLLQPGQIQRAEMLASRWLREEPQSPLAWASLGLVYGVQREYEVARFHFEKSRFFHPDFPMVWLNEARTCLPLREYDNALHLARHALRLLVGTGEEQKALRVIGVALNERFEFKEAQALFRGLGELGYQDPNIVVSLFATGQIREALESLNAESQTDLRLLGSLRSVGEISPGPVFQKLSPLVNTLAGFCKRGTAPLTSPKPSVGRHERSSQEPWSTSTGGQS